MSAYYNENDPQAAEWLRELIRAGLIASGDVDERSIKDVCSDDVKGYTQAHFFAGIGGWSYALRLAGWPDDQPAWTGSCPCQPFSTAGKRKGTADERHLWPDFLRLIAKCRPAICFGEQVASKDGMLWLAGVRTDLEESGYAVGCANLCAAGVSAPHLRQRLYWVADANFNRRQARNIASSSVGYRNSANSASGGIDSRVVNPDGYHKQWWSGPLQVGWNAIEGTVERGGRKYRAQWRIEPGLSIVAHGIPGRVAQLCGLGNAIVPQLAAEFIQAFIETCG